MARGLFVATRSLLSSCGARSPECVGSVVVAHEFSCPAAWGNLSSPTRDRTPELEGGFLTTGPSGKSRKPFVLICLPSLGLYSKVTFQ